MSKHVNMVKMGVTSIASAGEGTITLGAASSGFLHINVEITANDTVDIRISNAAGAFEVCRNCTFTYSATPSSCTITRGTLETGSNGTSRVAFDTGGSGVTVEVVATADSGRRWDSAALTYVAATVTTGNATGVVNTMHGLDIDGMTAARDFLLPTVAATDDRVGVFCTTDAPTTAAYVLQIKSGAAGDLINGTDHSSTIWSALLIKGECLIFRCINGATADWIVEYDGRIPQSGLLSLTTNATGEAANTTTRPSQSSGAWTAATSVGGVADAAADYIKVRRTGKYNISAMGAPVLAITPGNSIQVWIMKNSYTTDLVLYVAARTDASGEASGNSAYYPYTGASGISLAAGDFISYAYRSNQGSRGLLSQASPRFQSFLSVQEVL